MLSSSKTLKIVGSNNSTTNLRNCKGPLPAWKLTKRRYHHRCKNASTASRPNSKNQRTKEKRASRRGTPKWRISKHKMKSKRIKLTHSKSSRRRRIGKIRSRWGGNLMTLNQKWTTMRPNSKKRLWIILRSSKKSFRANKSKKRKSKLIKLQKRFCQRKNRKNLLQKLRQKQNQSLNRFSKNRTQVWIRKPLKNRKSPSRKSILLHLA